MDWIFLSAVSASLMCPTGASLQGNSARTLDRHFRAFRPGRSRLTFHLPHRARLGGGEDREPRLWRGRLPRQAIPRRGRARLPCVRCRAFAPWLGGRGAGGRARATDRQERQGDRRRAWLHAAIRLQPRLGHPAQNRLAWPRRFHSVGREGLGELRFLAEVLRRLHRFSSMVPTW
jgi:hypothetical protein